MRSRTGASSPARDTTSAPPRAARTTAVWTSGARAVAAERALSDRAVAETAGQVLLYQGELVDALYSSTCGGHTEDGKVMFPLKDEPYLKGVPCSGAGTADLPGGLPPGVPFPEGLTRRLLPPPAGATPATAPAA